MDLFVNSTITSLGGNQYKVTIKNKTKVIDMDGITIISDENMDKLENAGLSTDGFFTPDMWADNSEHPEHDLVIAQHILNYSGFDVDEWLKNNQ